MAAVGRSGIRVMLAEDTGCWWMRIRVMLEEEGEFLLL
jgi:hypothetical protein